MPTAKIMLIWLGAHLVMWGITIGFGTFAGVTTDCDSILCGTALAGILDVLASFGEQSNLLLTVVKVLTSDIIGLLWGLLSFNYQLLNQGEHGMVFGLIGFVLRGAGTLGGTILLIAAVSNLLQSR